MISERAKLVSWAYLVTDLAATTAAFVGAHAIRSWGLADWVGPVYPLSDYAPLLTAFVLPVWALVFYVSGLYGRRAARTLHTEMSRLFRALMVCALSLAVAVVVFRLAFISRPLLGLFLLLNAVGVVVGRGLVRAVILDSAVRRRVVVAGGLDEVRAAAASVETHADWGLELVGVVSDGTWSAAHLAADDGPRWRVLGTYEDIPALMSRDHHVIDEVLIAPSGRRLDDLQDLEAVFLALEEQGIVARLAMNFLPRSISRLSFDQLGEAAAPHLLQLAAQRGAAGRPPRRPTSCWRLAARAAEPGAARHRHRRQARTRRGRCCSGRCAAACTAAASRS